MTPKSASDNVVLLEPAAAALRNEFIGWQCRLRQLAARQAGGRPIPGMRPRVLSPAGEEIADSVVVLIVEKEPHASTAQMRFQYEKTQDPIERYDKVLDFLSAGYFQQPKDFSDVMTALFGAKSATAAALLNHGGCVLEFAQFGQAYRIPCAVAELARSHPFHQATYWHNHLFNPNLPPAVRILAFTPDWKHASGRKIEDT